MEGEEGGESSVSILKVSIPSWMRNTKRGIIGSNGTKKKQKNLVRVRKAEMRNCSDVRSLREKKVTLIKNEKVLTVLRIPEYAGLF